MEIDAMTRVEQSTGREATRRRELETWATEHDIDLGRFDSGQRWVLFAACNAVKVLGVVAPLQRVLGFFLAHCGMDLGSQVIAALIGVTDRAVRFNQELSPQDLLHSVQHPVGGHRPPALQPHHAGPLAKYFVKHSDASVAEILAFIRKEFGVTIERHTLQNFVERYGLGCLKDERLTSPPPFWEERAAAARSF
jgi:hypothetical protein